MKKTILVGGKAGQGIAKISLLIGKALASMGLYVFVYKDYQSLVRGGHNFDILEVSHKPVYSHSNKFDIIVALDENTLNVHQKDLTKEGIILSKDYQGYDTNNYLVDALFKSLHLSLKNLLSTTQDIFADSANKIKKFIKKGYEQANVNNQLDFQFRVSKSKILLELPALAATQKFMII